MWRTLPFGIARLRLNTLSFRTHMAITIAPRTAISLIFALICPVSLMTLRAATLKPATARAWDQYYQWADAKVRREVKDPQSFLIQDRLSPGIKQEVQRSFDADGTYIERMSGVIPADEKFSVPDGEIYHWWGTVLVPNIKLDELLSFLKDYDHHAGKFSDIVASRLIAREGDHFTFAFRLLRSKAFVTACFNTIQEATYYRIDAKRAWSKSVATRIAEVDSPGTPREHELAPGEGLGILWRLVSWWRFRETDRGVVVEIESASLSRDIPIIVTLIPGASSYIRSTPRESMESVLLGIRRRFAAPR